MGQTMLFLHFGLSWATMVIPVAEFSEEFFPMLQIDASDPQDWHNWSLMPEALKPAMNALLMSQLEKALDYLFEDGREELFLNFCPVLQLAAEDSFVLKPKYLEMVKRWNSSKAAVQFIELYPQKHGLNWLLDLGLRIEFSLNLSNLNNIPNMVRWHHLFTDHDRFALGYFLSENWLSIEDCPRIPLIRLVNYLLNHIPAIFQRVKMPNVEYFTLTSKIFSENSRIWTHLGAYHLREHIMLKWVDTTIDYEDRTWQLLTCIYMPNLMQRLPVQEVAALMPEISILLNHEERRFAVAPIDPECLEDNFRSELSLFLQEMLLQAQNEEEIGKVLSGLLAIDKDVSFDYESLKLVLIAGFADMLSLKKIALVTYPNEWDRGVASDLAARLLMEPTEVNDGWSDILAILPYSWKYRLINLFIIPKSTGVFFDEEDQPLATFPTEKSVLTLLFAMGFSIIATLQSATRLRFWMLAASEIPEAWVLFPRDLKTCLNYIPDENITPIWELLRQNPPYIGEIAPELFASVQDRVSQLPNSPLIKRDDDIGSRDGDDQ